jgi:hypothetical protein
MRIPRDVCRRFRPIKNLVSRFCSYHVSFSIFFAYRLHIWTTFGLLEIIHLTK